MAPAIPVPPNTVSLANVSTEIVPLPPLSTPASASPVARPVPPFHPPPLPQVMPCTTKPDIIPIQPSQVASQLQASSALQPSRILFPGGFRCDLSPQY
ncbi:hypothetical protein PTTG_11361 [Puccinia triticina 1-1 BBBD Race 1]|uniref:Uncharacterized protein n=1 Tax=Puccinia triticina (isolate 1-1 / race 1 (BBBD)) TaxID=630390 RepID=A0A180FXV4_PUCT1|nr:hypothetical protein PTTG_11361 [Puccinia triticina 1-1 BBBD Race 1]